jgi:hypothetical protein
VVVVVVVVVVVEVEADVRRTERTVERRRAVGR